MNCTNCHAEMEKGYLNEYGHIWSQKVDMLKVKLDKLQGDKLVVAWKCPKCGKVELVSEI